MIASVISQLWAAWFARAILHPQTWNEQTWCVPKNFIHWAPNIQHDVHPPVSIHDHEALCPRSIWRPQPQGERRCND